MKMPIEFLDKALACRELSRNGFEVHHLCEWYLELFFQACEAWDKVKDPYWYRTV